MNETTPAANASGNAAKSEVGRVATMLRTQLRLSEKDPKTGSVEVIALDGAREVNLVVAPVGPVTKLSEVLLEMASTDAYFPDRGLLAHSFSFATHSSAWIASDGVQPLL
jgi:hypothetical protein